MINKRYFVQTFGCQMNEHDSETIEGLLEANGYVAADSFEDADICLLNTCCIREKAEHKVFSMLGEMRPLFEKKPDLIVGVCGCMIQQKDIVPQITKTAPFVKLLTGTHNIYEIPQLIQQIEQTGEAQFLIDEASIISENGRVAKRKYDFKGFVNIIYGCNNFCSYCIVPYVRGRERSRLVADIEEEVRDLVADGAKEITLLGQNVNSYGNDLGEENLFPKLLARLDKIDGLERLRFMTSHPKDFSDELIEVMRLSDHICPSIHLPVQSGSNRILKKMNRKYTREHYLERLTKIKENIPNVAITTDIIVGFPGESEEDFLETLSLVEEAQFDNAFSFIYSKRQGTLAEKMEEEKVALDIKKERLQRLNERLSYWSAQNNAKYQDQVVKVLVEGVSKNDSMVLSGRTDTGKTVLFVGEDNLIGSFVLIKITDVQTWVLKGEQITLEDN